MRAAEPLGCDCRKIAYDSQVQARRALVDHREGSSGKIGVYRCPGDARLWHIGHSAKRRPNGTVRPAGGLPV